MAKQNTTSSKTQLNETEIKKQDERKLLDSWHSHIENTMKNLHEKFKSDSKFILTESDLKCWLFYYLQQEKPYVPFAVHTEVTHYAKHKVEDKEVVEKKYKFRDLSLLCSWKIKDNEEFLAAGGSKKDILNKGFVHKAPAIHFELKFVRQGNNLDSLESDITKLNNYSPNGNAERRFVIVWGSRCSTNDLAELRTEFNKSIPKLTKNKDLVEFYLFDVEKMIYMKWDGQNFTEKEISETNELS